MPEYDLTRFIKAQEPIYDQAVEELRSGSKQSHWMWFIFPQLSGLGKSATAIRFGIQDLNHARRYLNEPVLGFRLRQCAKLMLANRDKSAYEILGSPDDLKFRSCLTLFREASENESDRSLFTQGLVQFFDGHPDPRTIEFLNSA
jgi:uncharacterized protein (DUF1810 family)